MNKYQWPIPQWIVVWSAMAAVAVAQPPQRGGQPAGASAGVDAGLFDEFAPSNQPGRSSPPRRGVVGGQNPNAAPATNARGTTAATPVTPETDPAAAGETARTTTTPGPNRMFLAIDVNNDGIISAQELRRAATSLKVLDADSDGNITLAEVTSGAGAGIAAGQMTPMNGPAAMVEQMIVQNDKNGDGQLSPEEIPPQMARMFPQMDANGDGRLTREELTAAAANMANQFGGMMGGAGGAMNGQGGMQQLMQYDLNRDGRLTPNEVPQQMAAMLQGADANRDGAIDMQEIAAFAQMGQMGQGGRGMGRGPGGEFPPADGRGPRRGNQ